MIRVLTYIAIAVVLAVGCTKSEPPQTNVPNGYTPSDSPISFTTEDNWGDESDNPATKGLIFTSDSLKSFTTFAYYLPGTESAVGEWSDELIPNFMYNQAVGRTQLDDGTYTEWSYNPMKYWSDKPNDRFRFFACAPHNCFGVELSNNTDKGAPIFTVTPRSRPYYHQDFMTAKALVRSKDDNKVNFVFEHKLAQAKIYVAHKGSKADSVRILGISVSGFRERGYLIYDEVKEKYVWKHRQPEYSNEPFETKTFHFLAAKEHPNELKMGSDANIAQLDELTTDISKYTDPSLAGGKAHMFLVPQDYVEEVKIILFFDYYAAPTKETEEIRIQSFQKFIFRGSALKEAQTTAYLLLVDPVSIGYGEITTTFEPWDPKTVDNGGDDWIIE